MTLRLTDSLNKKRNRFSSTKVFSMVHILLNLEIKVIQNRTNGMSDGFKVILKILRFCKLIHECSDDNI